MSVTDPIADMLTRVRNAVLARHDFVVMPASKMKISIARLLKSQGFIKDYEVLRGQTPQRMLKIYLSYVGRKQPALTGLKRVSKPGFRVYVPQGRIPRVYGGLGLAILSTSKGIMTGKDAWKQGMGGEVLCYVW